MDVPFPTNKPLHEIIIRPVFKKNTMCCRHCIYLVKKSKWMYCECSSKPKF